MSSQAEPPGIWEMYLQKLDLRDAFRIEKTILTLSGFYPGSSANPLYVFSGAFNLFVSYGQFFATISQMIADRNDLSRLTDDLLYFATHVTFLFKLANFSYHKKNILEMEEELKPQDSVFYTFSEHQLEKLKRKVESCMFFGKIFRALCVFGVIFYALGPYLDKAKALSLPVPGWYPYNVCEYYFPTYGFQVISLCITANTNSTIDIFTWILITMSCSQFSILKDNLRNIRYSFRNDAEIRKAEEHFKICIDHHRAVIRFVKKIEDTFSNGIILQFFASLVAICVTCFQIVVVPVFSSRFIFCVSYFFCMIIQVAMYCWYGHDIMMTSDEIGRYFFMSNWYDSNLKVRKTMLIFLERVKRPVKITAGGFVPLSLATLVVILRLSYSYFAVLERIYTGK